ncbi:dihydroxyacetone kinase family protein [Renibacterium salmoninarum ATCC 33209]|uniref:Dihydroxyacetone kinase family protein n=1 Tax=Renibacterium salmoninarum (strain ATCC 33209 / DSM 20767 / JCM 11484 / NBRC 15589 / NCIMB 2235) TaxID=288705 RepID=A9WMZ8_RENSM|nr:DAK2 domain-containing protein [Renibacterium salmoninarum]ABY23518.1 dihydroxyacetone kinase family protein [Renibacterium salmoninarum ATCC 33209]
MQTKIAANASALRRWLSRCEETLGNHSDRLNAINIFPVADGDTGTNLYLTLRSANQAIQSSEGSDLGEVLNLAAEAAMENALGNSGTLLAVLLAAMSEPMRGATRLSAPLLASALRRAQIRSWSALSDPLQGTMLSVLESAAEAAAMADSSLNGDDSNHALSLALDAAVEAALAAVIRTEEQLSELQAAQVVDAGGVGLLLVLDCLRAEILHQDLQENLLDGLAGYDVHDNHIHQSIAVVEGVEVMCTITLSPLDAATLRMRLDELGDSVVMSPMVQEGEPDSYRWRVHVHTTESEKALEAIQLVGVPENISVSDLRAATHDHADG